ncbi:hypothetical protein D3C73_507840 [compost metagenome]
MNCIVKNHITPFCIFLYIIVPKHSCATHIRVYFSCIIAIISRVKRRCHIGYTIRHITFLTKEQTFLLHLSTLDITTKCAFHDGILTGCFHSFRTYSHWIQQSIRNPRYFFRIKLTSFHKVEQRLLIRTCCTKMIGRIKSIVRRHIVIIQMIIAIPIGNLLGNPCSKDGRGKLRIATTGSHHIVRQVILFFDHFIRNFNIRLGPKICPPFFMFALEQFYIF